MLQTKDRAHAERGVGGEAEGVVERVTEFEGDSFSGGELEGRFWERKQWTRFFTKSGRSCWSSSSSSTFLFFHQQSFGEPLFFEKAESLIS